MEVVALRVLEVLKSIFTLQGLSCFSTYFSFIINRPMFKYGIASPLKIDFG